MSPKLDPTAKDFTSLFSFRDKKEKPEKSSKAKGKERDHGTPKADANDLSGPSGNNDGQARLLRGGEDESPPQSRKSRDIQSVTTADSSANDHSPRVSLERSYSHTTSDAPNPGSYSGSIGKESFMQKLSRKSSGSKFGLPSFSRDKKQRAADKAKEATLGEEGDEDDLLSNSIDSIGAAKDKDDKKQDRASMLSWSSVFSGKIGKSKEKGEEQTPSISEASMSTDATGEDGASDT